jgi:outer membrane lipoprotein carrier protein
METLHGVENRYNRVRTLEVSFQQSYVQGRVRRSESGELFLRKPGRMRWQYTAPAGKFFIADGQFMFLYSPTSNRVEKTRMRDSEDMRAPLAFLLGKLNFDRDFKRYTYRAEGQNLWVTAEPKSDKLPYTEVSFLISPTREIRKLQITGQDQSVMEFQFANEKLNPALADSLFQFKAPAGAEVVEPYQTAEGR